jgi:hypothetical protein
MYVGPRLSLNVLRIKIKKPVRYIFFNAIFMTNVADLVRSSFRTCHCKPIDASGKYVSPVFRIEVQIGVCCVLHVVFLLAFSSTCSSNESDYFQKNTRRYIQEDKTLGPTMDRCLTVVLCNDQVRRVTSVSVEFCFLGLSHFPHTFARF